MDAVEAIPSVRDDLVEHLSTGLAAAVNLLNPELILLGGIFVDAPPATFDRIRDALRAKVFPVLRDAVRVERSTLGRDAGVIGGAAYALDRFFYSPQSTSS
jgi:predicted NBD/HSP70 family sugar kinase